VLIFRT